MKRNEIIKRLLSEGFTHKTLSELDDKQIFVLSSKILGEQQTIKGSVVMKKGTNPMEIKKITDTGINVEVREEECMECDKSEMNERKPSAGLTKKQKSDVVKKAKKGGDIGKKGKGFEDVEKKATKQYGSKEKGQKVAAAAMWKNIQREEDVKEELIGGQKKLDVNKNGKLDKEDFKKLRKNKLNEWVNNLVNENYSITTKGEISSIIKQKLTESNGLKFNLPEDTEDCVYADGISMDQTIAQKIANDNAINKFGGRFPNKPYIKHVETAHRTDGGDFRYIVGIKLKSEEGENLGDIKGEIKEQGYAPAKPKTNPKTIPTTKPGERIKPRTPYQPGPGINPDKKANLPEWMKFDNIKKN